MKSILVYLLLLLLLFGCSNNSNKIKMSGNFVEFSTIVNISIYDIVESDREDVKQLLKSVQSVFAKFDTLYNPNKSYSKLNNLNRLEPNKYHKIPDCYKTIIYSSREIYSNTEGNFDPAIEMVSNLWKFDADSLPELPDSDQLSFVVSSSGLSNIEFKEDSLKFLTEQVKFGFGAIAKGLAVDSAAAYLDRAGYHSYIIDAGGDLTISRGELRTIGLRDPRDRGVISDTLKIEGRSIATSGDYEKFFIKDGKRYCHILNPKTGISDSDLISVSVLSDKAYLSDALATSIFVMGYDDGKAYILKNGIDAIIMREKDGKVEKEYFGIY
jgi:thiamine biosynthesis lipoprotein